MHAALTFVVLIAQGYGLREARYDAQGGLTLGKQRVVLAEKQAAPIRKALDDAKLDSLPPPPPPSPRVNLAKLSEPFTLTLVFKEKTVTYQLNTMTRDEDPDARLLPIVLAVRSAVDYLDTPAVETATGRFEVGVQDGRVGVGVDAWSLYRPLADGPLVEQLRPYKGRRIKMEIARERDRPDVFVLKRLLQKL